MKLVIRRNTVPFVLHKIVDGEPLAYEDMRLTVFNKLLDSVKDNVILPGDTQGEISRGDVSSTAWMLTFDDGYMSDYHMVFPRLQNSGVRAIFFVVTDWIGKKGHLSWENIKEMHRYGMLFGSHSVAHHKFSKLSMDEAKDEILISKKILENSLGEKVPFFSFPYGDYRKRHIQMVLDNGYEHCFTSRHGMIDASERIFPRNSLNSCVNEDNIMRYIKPSIYQRVKWKMEDAVKYSLKHMLGDGKIYSSVRTGISKVLYK